MTSKSSKSKSTFGQVKINEQSHAASILKDTVYQQGGVEESRVSLINLKILEKIVTNSNFDIASKEFDFLNGILIEQSKSQRFIQAKHFFEQQDISSPLHIIILIELQPDRVDKQYRIWQGAKEDFKIFQAKLILNNNHYNMKWSSRESLSGSLNANLIESKVKEGIRLAKARNLAMPFRAKPELKVTNKKKSKR